MAEEGIVDAGHAREVVVLQARPLGREIEAVVEGAERDGYRLDAEALALGVDDQERFGRLGDDHLPASHR